MGSKYTIEPTQLLEKLKSSELTAQEKENLRAYIKSTFRDKELDHLMTRHWDQQNGTVEEHDLYFHLLRDKIWRVVKTKQESHLGKDFRKPKWTSYLSRIAAILFIPLLIGSAFLYYRLHQHDHTGELVMQEVFAMPGSRVNFTLPDQTQVWLNSGSSIKYPVNFTTQNTREVILSGQGYFEVAHHADQPFIVRTSELNIRVLGTSFDVSNYADERTMSSTLEEGSISLLNANGEEIAKLKPGQRMTLDRRSRKMLVEEVETYLTTSWKDGKLIFKEAPLEETVVKLERWFNCKISVSTDLLNSGIRYTATIQNETIEEVLKMIEISTSVKTKIEDRKVTIWSEN